MQQLKRQLRWQGDAVEAALEEETGLSLLFCAAAMDDVAAVRELLHDGAAPAQLNALTLVGCLQLSFPAFQNPMNAAVLGASWAVIAALLNAGAAVEPGVQSTLFHGEARRRCTMPACLAGQTSSARG